MPNEISLVIGNLTSGYHRDLQILKESLFPAIEQLKQCLSIADYALSQIIVNETTVDDEMYRYLFSVESVNREVLAGVPFRDAYRKIGQQIAEGTFEPSRTIKHTHEGSIGNLCNDQIAEKMNFIIKSFDFEKAEQAVQNLVTVTE